MIWVFLLSTTLVILNYLLSDSNIGHLRWTSGWQINGPRSGLTIPLHLRKAHVHLSEAENEVVWNYPNTDRRYTTKLRYQAMVSSNVEGSCWLYKDLWKVNDHPKGKLFL